MALAAFSARRFASESLNRLVFNGVARLARPVSSIFDSEENLISSVSEPTAGGGGSQSENEEVLGYFQRYMHTVGGAGSFSLKHVISALSFIVSSSSFFLSHLFLFSPGQEFSQRSTLLFKKRHSGHFHGNVLFFSIKNTKAF